MIRDMLSYGLYGSMSFKSDKKREMHTWRHENNFSRQ